MYAGLNSNSVVGNRKVQKKESESDVGVGIRVQYDKKQEMKSGTAVKQVISRIRSRESMAKRFGNRTGS